MLRRCPNAVTRPSHVSAVKFAVLDSCWPITSGEWADAFPSASPARLKLGRSRKGDMASKNDAPGAKEIFESVRRFGKGFLEHLYTAAEKDGNLLLPQEAIALFFRLLRDHPPQPDRTLGELTHELGFEVSPDLTDEEEARIGSRLYRQLCDDALAAYRRHTPGFQKRLSGAPRKDSLANEATQLKEAGLSYAKIARHLNQSHGKGTTTQENIRGLLKSRRLQARKVAPPDKTRS